MADFFPFHGIRFNPNVNFQDLTVFDTDEINGTSIEAENLGEFHSARLLFPQMPSGLHNMIRAWIKSNTLLQEQEKSYYSYQQAYKLPGTNIEKTRTGVIGLVEIGDCKDSGILPHENVIDWKVNPLKEYLAEGAIQGTMAIGFYDTRDNSAYQLIEESLKSPEYILSHKECTHKLGLISNPDSINSIRNEINKVCIYLADGHHRYNALLKLAKERKQPFYLMMLLVNEQYSDMTALPFHRLYKGNFNKELFLENISKDFDVNRVHDHNYIDLRKQTFRLILKDQSYVISLKPEKIKEIYWNFPKEIKELDHTILHYFIFEKYLGIRGKDQKNSKNIKFCSIFTDCITEVESGNADFGLAVNGIDLEQIKKVASSGFFYPQKSTFFYPKTVSGLLFAPTTL